MDACIDQQRIRPNHRDDFDAAFTKKPIVHDISLKGGHLDKISQRQYESFLSRIDSLFSN